MLITQVSQTQRLNRFKTEYEKLLNNNTVLKCIRRVISD